MRTNVSSVEEERKIVMCNFLIQPFILHTTDPSLKALRFLYESYQPKYWYFEVFETLRKLSLTGFLVFLFNGQELQVLVALLICMIGLRIYAIAQPFISPTANDLVQVTQFQLLLTIMAALAIRTNIDGRKLKKILDLMPF